MAKEIYIKNKDVYAIVDDADYNYISSFNWYGHGKEYVFIKGYVHGEIVIMSRLLLGIIDNKELVADHIDGNPLNNQRSNLRICTSTQNAWNRSKRGGLTSKYKGVAWHKHTKAWKASTSCNNKYYYIGVYENEAEAALAYNEVAKQLFGDFAKLNVITDPLPEKTTKKPCNRVKRKYIAQTTQGATHVDTNLKNLCRTVGVEYLKVKWKVTSGITYSSNLVSISILSEKDV